MNEQKLELKPCPFCGEVPVEGYRLGADWHKCESGEVYISCSSPKHEGVCLQVYGENFEQAVKTWNDRAPLPDNKALTVRDTAMVCGVRTTNRGIGVSGEYDIDSDLICPVCGAVVGDAEHNELNGPFCSECGQRLSQPAGED